VKYLYECSLRWSDMDAYGHVNNARFLTLYEEARVDLFFTGARATGLTSFEDGIIISRHEIDYLRTIDFAVGPTGAPRPPVVRVEMWVEEIRPSRFTVAYELCDQDGVASRARTVCVPFDLSRQRPRRISEAERAYLSRWLREPPAIPTSAPPSRAATSAGSS
jgi:acyl-CoA thioester hydrolase